MRIPYRYGIEHCKVALLLSALLFFPLKSAVAISLSAFIPFKITEPILYAIFLGSIVLLFLVPFLLHLICTKDMILLGSIVLLGFLLFGFRRPEEINAVYGRLFVKSMIMAFPYYVVARNLKDYDLFERALYSGSFVINISTLIAMAYSRHSWSDGYGMAIAYAVLPGAIIAFRRLLRCSSLVAMLNVGISLFVLIFSGTRGPVLCYMLFCIYEMTFNRTLAGKHVINKIVASCVVGIILFASIFTIMGSSPRVLGPSRRNMLSTRLFQVIERGTFFSDTGRSRIRQIAIETIEENPFLGVGLLEDRLQIFRRGDFAMTTEATNYGGYYSHCIFLDLLLEFGVIIGGLLILGLSIFFFKIFLLPHSTGKSCIEIFFFAGCIPLLFSGNWHEEWLFYITLGMSASIFEKWMTRRNCVYGESIG